MEQHYSFGTLLKSYNSLSTKSERFSFYFNCIRPAITSVLKEQIEQKIKNNQLPVYSTLVIILGSNPNPSLIVTNSIIPQHLVVFYPNEHKKVLDTYFLSFLDPAINKNNITTIPINYTHHDINYNILHSTLSRLSHAQTLCDITSGKKILAFQLGLIAKKLGFDICYLDAQEYIKDSDIPIPGKESLYIYTLDMDVLTTINVNQENNLRIHYLPTTHELLYTIDTNNGTFKYIHDDFSFSSIQTTMQTIELFYKKINSHILNRLSITQLIDELSDNISSLFKLYQFEHLLKESNIKLYLDIELAGIPWEIPLHRIFKVQLPVIRVITQSSIFRHRSSVLPRYEGVLFVIGANNNIKNFPSSFNSVINHIQKSNKVNIIEAKSKGYLQSQLIKRQYQIIIYLGHSQFDNHAKKTGWVCHNGEIFHSKNFSIFSSKPPETIISLSCNSAWSIPFTNHSLAYNALQAGVKYFIGANYFVDYEKSIDFIKNVILSVVEQNAQLEVLKDNFFKFYSTYNKDDLLPYNFTFYSQ